MLHQQLRLDHFSPAALHVEGNRCKYERRHHSGFRWHKIIGITAEEVEGEVVPSVESEFEKAKAKRTQKEEYVAPRESLAK